MNVNVMYFNVQLPAWSRIPLIVIVVFMPANFIPINIVSSFNWHQKRLDKVQIIICKFVNFVEKFATTVRNMLSRLNVDQNRRNL